MDICAYRKATLDAAIAELKAVMPAPPACGNVMGIGFERHRKIAGGLYVYKDHTL